MIKFSGFRICAGFRKRQSGSTVDVPAAEDKSTQPRLNYRALSGYLPGDVLD